MTRARARTTGWVFAALLSLALAPACGLKGPPLPPLPETPQQSDRMEERNKAAPSPAPAPSPSPSPSRKKKKKSN